MTPLIDRSVANLFPITPSFIHKPSSENLTVSLAKTIKSISNSTRKRIFRTYLLASDPWCREGHFTSLKNADVSVELSYTSSGQVSLWMDKEKYFNYNYCNKKILITKRNTYIFSTFIFEMFKKGVTPTCDFKILSFSPS